MPEPSLPSLLVLAAGLLALLGAGIALWLGRRSARPKPLPAQWALAARPVFNADERRLYRLLREALPQHVVLAKLPLVRFCQPAESDDERYWYDLLGATYVSLAVCSASGRVLTAIDIEDRGSGSRRSQQIKQAMLGACHIRYLRCAADELPTLAELRLLVPQAGSPERRAAAAAGGVFSSTTVSGLPDDTDMAPAPTPHRRPRRPVLWQDSGFLNDSFFGADHRAEASYPSPHGPYSTSAPLPPHSGQRHTPRGDGRRRDPPLDPVDERHADERYDDPYDARQSPPLRRASRPMPLDHGLWPAEPDDDAEVRRFDGDRRGARASRPAPLHEQTRPGAAGHW